MDIDTATDFYMDNVDMPYGSRFAETVGRFQERFLEATGDIDEAFIKAVETAKLMLPAIMAGEVK